MSAGLGARIALGSNVFVAPEFRLGWEPETRIAVTIGMRLRCRGFRRRSVQPHHSKRFTGGGDRYPS